MIEMVLGKKELEYLELESNVEIIEVVIHDVCEGDSYGSYGWEED
jgi:hypothetical protein